MLFSGTPTILSEFSRLYASETACHNSLTPLRWTGGFVCPRCGPSRAWNAGRSRTICRRCGLESSDTAGTLLHRNRLPITTLFLATWLVATTPGLNSISLARQTGISQKAAWRLLGTMRAAMGRSLISSLSGVVEADEAFFGRKEHEQTVEVLAEARPDRRVRMAALPGQSKTILTPFIAARVEPGSTIRTDGWKGYLGLTEVGFTHERLPHNPGWVERGERATPYADEAISAAKRWLLATYNKPPTPANLDAYLAEFCFRREFREPGAAFEALLRGLVTPR